MGQLDRAVWRKSSHSGGNGGDYVEAAAVWRKSSHSGGNGGGCVEAAAVWRKSSHSGGNGGDCVEVASRPAGTVAVRDSKDRGGPQLAVSDRAWSRFVQGVKRGEFDLA